MLVVLYPSSPPAMLIAGIHLEGVCRIHIVPSVSCDCSSSSRKGYVVPCDVIRDITYLWSGQARLAFKRFGHVTAMSSVNRFSHFVSIALCDFGVDT